MMGNPSTRRTKRITKQSDESNWRSRKWEKPIQEVESPSFTPKTQMSIKLENDDEQNQRNQLKEIITQRIKSQSIAQSTAKSIEEIATEEDEETETDEEETVETTKEQKKRRELIHVYLTSMMDNKDEQTEQDETETYLRTSMEEEQKSSMEEEYNEDEPFEENNEVKWMTPFSYPTEEEENTLFSVFMTGNVEDQKTWINAKMSLTRTLTNEETGRREEEILDRIIPTGIMDLDEDFEEEETDNLSEC
jgi:hypothetical protein